MKIAIHQPNFLAWGGYFEKMREADFFVILDDVQYSSGGYTNRVMFGNDKVDPFWFTIPVKKKFGQLICDVEISDYRQIHKKLENSIKLLYPNAYFDFEELFEIEYFKLADLNIDFILKARKILGINTPLVYSSDIPKQGSKGDLILDIVQYLGGDTYLSGGASNKYLDLEAFEKNGIKVEFTDYTQKFSNKTILYYIEKQHEINGHEIRTESKNTSIVSSHG
jgi:hypothetical protein